MNPVSKIAAEVAGYADVAKRIIDLAVFGAAQNRSHSRLADFTDTIGNRVSGSHDLEMAIKYMYNAFAQDGLDVHLGEYDSLSLSLRCRTMRIYSSQIKFVFCALFFTSFFFRACQNPTLGEREGECRNDCTQGQTSGYTRTG